MKLEIGLHLALTALDSSPLMQTYRFNLCRYAWRELR